jgi:hypothetical protein
VENALNLALDGKLKVLVLVGPTGSGKTACIEVICRYASFVLDLHGLVFLLIVRLRKIQIVQYINPLKLKYLDTDLKDLYDYEPVLDSFEEFCKKSKYPTLQFDTSMYVIFKYFIFLRHTCIG